MEEFEIIERVQAGDSRAFARIVERYHRPVLRFIYGLVGNSDMAEDIGQETFLRLFKNIKEFDVQRGVPFSAWIFLIARNLAISSLRRSSRSVSFDFVSDEQGSSPSAEKMAESFQRLSVVQESLRELPEPYRGSLLASLSGQSIQEIAYLSGVAEGTVKSRIFRARMILRQCLAQWL